LTNRRLSSIYGRNVDGGHGQAGYAHAAFERLGKMTGLSVTMVRKRVLPIAALLLS